MSALLDSYNEHFILQLKQASQGNIPGLIASTYDTVVAGQKP